MNMIDVTTAQCAMCRKTSVINMPEDAYNNWKLGEFIQNAWSEGTPEERELLISGVHPNCWDALFAEDD